MIVTEQEREGIIKRFQGGRSFHVPDDEAEGVYTSAIHLLGNLVHYSTGRNYQSDDILMAMNVIYVRKLPRIEQ